MWKKLLAGIMTLAIAFGTLMSGTECYAKEEKTKSKSSSQLEKLKSTEYGDYVSTIKTPQNSPVINPDYDRSYDNYEVRSEAGLLHPGILLNREELNVMRDMVWLGAEPWASAFEELQKSPYAQLDYKMDGPFEVIGSDRETYSLTRASTSIYELTLMWYITGKQEYADKAKEMILSWAHTVKTDQKYDHLRMGTSTHKICIAAEIMRYTPSSGWTEQDTADLNAYLDLVDYAINKPYEYLNQGGYALIAYTAKTIFQDDWNGYTQAVEREAYNVNAGWKDGNSLNFSLSAMVFNDGSFVEMGRDQWHAFDNMGTHSSVLKTSYVQETKVDEKGNIVSVGGTDLYEYGNQKMLKMAATLARYNFGEEVNYMPNQNAWGEKTEFSSNASLGRGMDFWEPSIYYHYRYIKGYSDDTNRTIENATEGTDLTKDPYLTYGDTYQYISNGRGTSIGKSANVDFPDFMDLTFTPLKAAEDSPLKGAPGDSVRSDDHCKEYNRYLANQYSGTGNDERPTDNAGQNGGIVTEPCIDDEGNSHFMTSDVNNGEWVAYSLDFGKEFGSTDKNPVDTLVMSYGTNTSGGDIDVYVGDYNENPTDEDYKKARDSQKIGTIHVEDTQGYTNFTIASQKFEKDKANLLTGKKNIYFYYYNSANVFKFHCDTCYFKFVSSRSTDSNTAQTNGFVKSDVSVDGRKATISDGGYIGFQNMDFDNGYTSLELTLSNSVKKGSLELYKGNPEKNGKLIQTVDISGKKEKVSYDQENKKALIGRNDIYLLYKGDETLGIESVSFEKVATKQSDYENIQAGDYLQVVQGDVKRTEGNGITMDIASGAYVSYNAVPFLTGPDTIGIRVKTDTACTLKVDQLNVGEPSDGVVGRDGNKAVLDVPDTTEISEDGWITLQCTLKKTDIDTGNNPLGIGVSGAEKGRIEIQYFRFNPKDKMPDITLSGNDGVSAKLGETIILNEDSGQKYELNVSDEGKDPKTTVQFYGKLPDGFEKSKKTLTVTAKAGEYAVKALTYDGENCVVGTFYFKVQDNEEQVRTVIKESGIEDSLLSLYVYNQELYQKYKTAVNAANAEPTDDNLNALRAEIEECIKNIPVYTKVKFGYRAQKSNASETAYADDTIQLFADTTEASLSGQKVNSGTRIATTGRVQEKDTVDNSWTSGLKTTDWIPLENTLSGSHSLTVQTDHWSTRFSYMILSNEDGTAVKKINAISYTERGDYKVIMEKANDPEIQADDIGMYGDSSWLRYTLDNYDLSGFVYVDKGQAAPFEGKNGAGIMLTVVPDVKTAIENAKSIYDNREKYTAESVKDFIKAYENALNAIENYETENLTTEKSKELAETLDKAIEKLAVSDAQVSVTVDEDSNLLLDESGNNQGNLTGANLSKNITLTGIAGEDVKFKLQVPEGASCTLKDFGYRGNVGVDTNALKEISPKLAYTPSLQASEGGGYIVDWNYNIPGNYRAVFEIDNGADKIEKVVEIVLRNQTVRTDIHPEYARVRFSAYHEADKVVDLFLMPVNSEGTVDENQKKTVTFSNLSRTGGKYVMSQWVKLPEDFDYSQTYQLAMQTYDTYIYVDFIEFGTESYKNLYPSDNYDTAVYQKYPLSSAGVLRIEAEHFDYNNIKDYEFIDFNGLRGFEHGSPGEGCGAVRMGGLWNQNKGAIVKYNQVQFAVDEGDSQEITLTVKDSDGTETYLMKGDSQQLEAKGESGEVVTAVSFASTNPGVATVGTDGKVTGISQGKATVTALNTKNSAEVTIYVADKDYLNKLIEEFDIYLSDKEDGYTSESWLLLTTAYENAKAAVEGENAETVYEAADTLYNAIVTRVKAAKLTALNTYVKIAEELSAEDFESGWEELRAALESAIALTKENSQEEVNEAASILQNALYALTEKEFIPADKTDLRNLVTEAEQIEKAGQGTYTDMTWNDFITALDRAREIDADDMVTETAVTVAQETLKLYMGQLETEAADFLNLQTLYNKLKEISPEAYTEESFAVLAEALRHAEAILNSPDASTMEQIEQSAQNLQAAADQLKQKTDKAALEAAYNQYKALEQENYTDESWLALQSALARAKETMDNPDATQEEINDRLKLIQDAFSYLCTKDDSNKNDEDDKKDPGQNDNKDNPDQNDNKEQNQNVNQDKPSQNGEINKGKEEQVNKTEALSKEKVEHTSSAVKTGDKTPVLIMIILLMGAVVTIVIITIIKCRGRHTKGE